MTINFYKNNSEANVLNKQIEAVITLEGYLRDATSVTSPTILVESENFIAANYVYIELFLRYFYITDMVSVRTNLWEIHLKSDPLMSFNNDVKNSYILLNDTESLDADSYLQSENWVVNCKHFTDIKNFSAGFDDTPNYILITSGGLT